MVTITSGAKSKSNDSGTGGGFKRDPNADAKRRCREKGGTWNSETNTCEMPKKESKQKLEELQSKKEITEKEGIMTSEERELTEQQRQEATKPIITRNKEGKIQAVRMPDGKVFSGLDEDTLIALAEKNAPAKTPAGSIEAQELAKQRKEALLANLEEQAQPEREELFKEETGAGALQEELMAKISAPMEEGFGQKGELKEKGGGIVENIGEVRRGVEGNKLGPELNIQKKAWNNFLNKNMSQEDINKMKGAQTIAQGAAALGLAGAAAAPAIGAAASAATSGFAGTALAALGGSMIGAGGGFPGTSIGEKQMETSRDVIQTMSSAGEDYRGLMDSGMSPEEAIGNLERMNKRLKFHENRIKSKSIANIEYRNSGQYYEDRENIREARRSILEATNAAINVASMGEKDQDLTKMVYHTEKLNEKNDKLKKYLPENEQRT